MKRTIGFLGFLGILLALNVNLSAAEPDSREYKFTLNNEKCATDAGIEECWKAVMDIAGKMNVPVKLEPVPWERSQREIVFYDTIDDAVRNSGFLLRQRTKIKNGQKKDVSDMTLKFRVPDRSAALAAQVAPGAGENAKIKFKEEWVLTPELNPGYQALYQNSAKLNGFKGADGATFDSWTKLFPGLAVLKLPPATPMGIVKDRRVLEDEQIVGTFILPGGVEAEAGFDCWRVNDKLLAAEFSYEIKGDLPSSSLALQVALNFYAQLAKGLGDRLNRAGTKTAEYYAE